uniref:hypothetical protein n=1 Tax=Synechococcus sp. UW106 TaxID=368495 RepID=UPI000E0F1684|nr:hypothetical protein [Synechococcus sp. UW106]
MFSRSLGLTSVDPKDQAVITAWSAIHTEAEALIAKAQAEEAGQLQQSAEVTPLSPRDAAGIAAEPWRKLLNAGDQGQITTDIEDMVAEVVLIASQAMGQAGKPGALEQIKAAKAAITQRMVGETLEKLQIQLDSQAMRQIQQRLLGYVPMFGADDKRRSEGDFSSGDIETKAPPLPDSQVTWEQLLEQYVLFAGGITEEQGIGISRARLGSYQVAIKQIVETTQKHFPNELTIDDARHFINTLQQSTLAIRTKQQKLTLIKTLIKTGLQFGLVDTDVFAAMKIKEPKGTTHQTYRSFSREELKQIYQKVHQIGDIERSFVFDALLCTGSRQGEVVYLRKGDIKKDKKDIYYFDFKHEPTAAYSTTLKGGAAGERKMPWHPLLLQQDYVKWIQEKGDGYIVDRSKSNSVWTVWFRDCVLKKVDAYEKGKTGLHSLRNTAIDLWRECGIDQEFRRAFVAHASKDVQDRVYGEGLKNMPAVMAKELKKLDLSWLS